MTSPDAHLITLVKLLDGHLSAAEGLAVREQLANDGTLRKHWQTLAGALGTDAPLQDSEHISEFDIETVAAFVEGELRDGEAASVEHAIWENAAALREVVGAIRAIHMTDAAGLSLKHRLEETVESELAIRLTDSLGETQTLHSTRRQLPGVNGTPASKDGLSPQSHPANRRATVADRQIPDDLSKRLGPGRIVTAAVAIVLLACVAIFFAMRNSDRPDNRPIVEQPTPDSKFDPPADGQSEGNRDQQLPDVPDSLNLVDKPDKQKPIVDQPPVPNSPRPDPIAPEGNDRGRFVQVAWSNVVGIAAQRPANRRRWSGLLLEMDNRSLNQPLAVRTLPHGWAQGKIASGPQVILAADTEIELLVRQRQASEPGRTTFDLQISRGNTAITRLSHGESIHVRDNRREWIIRADVDETAVGVVQLDALRRQIVVWNGAIQIDQLALAAGQSVIWNGRIFESPVADAAQQTWQRPPAASSLELRQPVIDAINRSPNVLQAITMQNRGGPKKDVRLAANLAFSLDAVVAVPMAARSNNETRRLAAIRWLLAAQNGQPQTTAVWHKIDSSLGTSQAQQTVRSWFQAAQNKTKPTRQQLAELSTGLGAQQPIFMRQAAIHFLRQITGQRFATYDPNRPTKQSIDAVRQQLRRAASGGKRRRP